MQGGLQIREKCPEAVLVFVLPPSFDELRRRLLGRQTEDMETVSRRLETARQEMQAAYDYDYIVVNDRLEDAVDELKAIFAAEKIKTANRKTMIDEVLRYDA